MRNIISRSVAAFATITLSMTATAAWSARYPTPNPKQSEFYERLQKSGSAIPRRANTALAPAAARSALAPAVKPAVTAAPYSTTFYFSAHPDDFMLFMNPYWDVTLSDVRVAFVFVTAGDAGGGTLPANQPYYLGREAGAQRAIRFMADVANSSIATPVFSTVTMNGHNIYRMAYKNTYAYFLRLPDGNADGSGFPLTGNTSIAKLKSGQITTLTAINGSATYRGWADLVTTVTALVKSQASGSVNVWLNGPDPSPTTNPGDHSDHLTTGSVVVAAQPTLPCVNLALHTGYSIGGLENLDIESIENKTSVYANYSSGMAEKGFPGITWDADHKQFLAGLILRVVSGNFQGCAF